MDISGGRRLCLRVSVNFYLCVPCGEKLTIYTFRESFGDAGGRPEGGFLPRSSPSHDTKAVGQIYIEEVTTSPL